MDDLKLEFTNSTENKIGYATDGSAGIDLPADKKLYIRANRTVLVPTGIKVAIPKGYCGVVMSRSGLGVKREIAVAQGVGLIDSDYRGEVFVPLYNRGTTGDTIEAGERIAQLVIMPVVQPELVEVKELSETERGEGGFGSTG